MLDGLLAAAATAIIALLVVHFVLKPYYIPTGSMENTLRCGDRVLVNRLSYHFGSPKRFQIVVFHPPAGRNANGDVALHHAAAGDDGGLFVPNNALVASDLTYVKRIVGMPGDVLALHDWHAYVNGHELHEPFMHPITNTAKAAMPPDFGPIIVPQGEYFMLGDDREGSADSRVFGPVPTRFLIGPVQWIYWPPSQAGDPPAKEAGGRTSALPDPKCQDSGNGAGDT